MEFGKGSEWSRWDLHIHTPETKKNDNFIGRTIEEKWDNYYRDINDYIGDGTNPLKNITVIGITDYVSLDNYKKVIKNRERLPKSIKLILPNLEMRIRPFAKDSPINIHFIFNPDIVDQVDEKFLGRLTFKYKGESFSATREGLTRLGKSMNPDYTEEQAYKEGLNCYVPSLDVIENVFANDEKLRDNTIVLVSNSTGDGASGATSHADYIDQGTGNNQLTAFKEELYTFADIIFSAKPSDIKYFLGEKPTCPASKVIEECGSLKPCVHGCDAHSNRKIFEPDGQKYCWIKAVPTFNGLKQIIYEPKERVRISSAAPTSKPEYHVIDKIIFDDENFQKEPIEFNENLTCIIGGKSTGKSILIHNLAKAIDRVQVEDKEIYSGNKIKDIDKVTVYWKDGEKDASRKIVYVPQTYLNRLSDSKENKTEIDNIIQDIVWLNDDCKKAYNHMLNAQKESKKTLERDILDLLDNNSEIRNLENKLKEVGDIRDIEARIKKLNKDKDLISAELNLSQDDLDSYNKAVASIKQAESQIRSLEEDLKAVEAIDHLVVERNTGYITLEATKALLEQACKKAMDAADAVWQESKKEITNTINLTVDENKRNKELNQEVEARLRPKIEGNESIAKLSKEIQQENEKLEEVKQLIVEKTKLGVIEEQHLDSISTLAIQFEGIGEEYAEVVNRNTDISGDTLKFKVLTPFKNDDFQDLLGRLFNNRNDRYKGLVNCFEKSGYNKDFLKELVKNILQDKLVLKKGETKERTIRSVCDNWYETKYQVEMDGDSIECMSPGKKALVLLKLLIDLADSQSPILIDQPEDDLDNRSIFNDLIPFMKTKKNNRQIIVVTHNANVVLGADAEEVIIANQQGVTVENKQYRFEYRSGAIEDDKPVRDEAGNIVKGILNSQGIQQHICDILEGGERAFELRKNKYHLSNER